MADSLSTRSRHAVSATTSADPVADTASPARPAGLMTVGSADDPAEAAADRAADNALSRLRRLSAGAEQPGGAGPTDPSALDEVHRHGHGCGHDSVQRLATPTTGPEVGRNGGELSTDTSTAIAGMRGSGAPLPTVLRENLETAFQTPLDRVRIHTGPRAEALNDAVSAHAFTVGQDIFFGAGSFRPETSTGAHTLAHEVAHTLQDGGAVHRTVADTPVRRYAKSNGGSKGGSFIGPPSGCHLHIDIAKPHFKVGTMQNTRIDFGPDLSLPRMQRAFDSLLASHVGKPGYDDCREWLEEQGCVEPEGEDQLSKLKEMLTSWGGLSENSFGYFEDGEQWTDVVCGSSQLDTQILAYTAEITAAAVAREAFMEAGGISDVDEDEMQAEQNELFAKDRKRAQSGK